MTWAHIDKLYKESTWHYMSLTYNVLHANIYQSFFFFLTFIKKQLTSITV